MSKPLLPPIESFTPEQSPPSLSCAEIAFSAIDNFGMKYEDAKGALYYEYSVTDRVDAVDIEPTNVFTAVRLRLSPWLPMVETDAKEPQYTRDFAVALVEVGKITVSPDDDPEVDGENMQDEDYVWTPTVAIIVDLQTDPDQDAIFICDAQTGRELSQAEQTELQFLLTYIQQNLQSEVLIGFLLSANEQTSMQSVSVKSSIEFNPADGAFIDGYECSECNIGYGLCVHNQRKLN